MRYERYTRLQKAVGPLGELHLVQERQIRCWEGRKRDGSDDLRQR